MLSQFSNRSILVISQNHNVAHKLTKNNSDILKIDSINQINDLALLHKKLQDNLDTNNVIDLLNTLDYMFLAISQTTAYINQKASHITVSKYLHDLDNSDKNRANLLKKNVEDAHRNDRVSNFI